MERDNLELLSVTLLKDMAKKRGIKGLSSMRKGQLIDALLASEAEGGALQAGRTDESPAGAGLQPEGGQYARVEAVQAERPGTAFQSGSMGTGIQAERPGYTAQAERPGYTAQAERPGYIAQAESAGSSSSGFRRDSAARTEREGSSFSSERGGSYERPSAGNARAQAGSAAGMARAGSADSSDRSYSQDGQDGSRRQGRFIVSRRPEERRMTGNRRATDSMGRPLRRRTDGSSQMERGGTDETRRRMDSSQADRQDSEDMRRRPDNGYQTDRMMADDMRKSPVSNYSADSMGYDDMRRRPDMTGQAERRMTDSRTEADGQAFADGDQPPMELRQLDSGNMVEGVLEVLADGYGFIRSDNYLPGEDDVYVSPSQIRRFNLKTGDIVGGNTRVHTQQEKFSALLFVRTINGLSPSEAAKRFNFEDMTPTFPNERLRMERSGREIAMRIVDLLSPIGKGQRGMIVSPPKAGKTTLLKDIAKSILNNNPEVHLIIMLIDERPEEVTDIREAIIGDNVEVLDSTFDETPEHHKRVAEMGIERAKRLVEHGRDVAILLDSITRLARAYNLIVPPSGRTLSGGLDPAALHPPKRFFGAARNMREGGSLTILATALVDTGSKMDDVVYEEFKGTGNMEMILDRKLSERRVFPAIDINKSGTRREDLLLDPAEADAALAMRRALNGSRGEEAVERILDLFAHTRSNAELVSRVRTSRIM